jgi:hypothetical protein
MFGQKVISLYTASGRVYNAKENRLKQRKSGLVNDLPAKPALAWRLFAAVKSWKKVRRSAHFGWRNRRQDLPEKLRSSERTATRAYAGGEVYRAGRISRKDGGQSVFREKSCVFQLSELLGIEVFEKNYCGGKVTGIANTGG